MAKILLVEDDPDIRFAVQNCLTRESHTVELVEDGKEALERLERYQYDVILLDIELPILSGVDVCKSFRLAGGKTPVLMLTGKTAVSDKEIGLDSGADDYLTKPFDLRELLARMRALLRRGNLSSSTNLLKIGILELNTATRKINRQGVEVYLLPRDFELLELFMRFPDEIFSADALLDRVWHNDKEVGPDALRSSLRRLRQKLGDTDCTIIENVPKVGYRLCRHAAEKTQ